MLLICIEGHIYEISHYVTHHPGEGIKNTYLSHYNRHDSTYEYQRNHFTDESDEILYLTRREGKHPELGVYYVSPMFFSQKKIPKYFYFNPQDPYGVKKIKEQPARTFLLRPSQADLQQCLSLTYHDQRQEIHQTRLMKTGDQWIGEWDNEAGEREDIIADTIEEWIQKTVILGGYLPVTV